VPERSGQKPEVGEEIDHEIRTQTEKEMVKLLNSNELRNKETIAILTTPMQRKKFDFYKAQVWINMKLTKSLKISFLLLECRRYSGEALHIHPFENTAEIGAGHCKSAIGEKQESERLTSSIITDYKMDIVGEEQSPVLVMFINESQSRQRNIGFLPSEVDAEILAMNFHTMIMEDALIDFVLIIIVVHKSILFFKIAFGKISRAAFPIFLCSRVALYEEMENIYVYHKF
ncbi:hypothetical protein E2I00_002627, partial [Balaenoptera physalus]